MWKAKIISWWEVLWSIHSWSDLILLFPADIDRLYSPYVYVLPSPGFIVRGGGRPIYDNSPNTLDLYITIAIASSHLYITIAIARSRPEPERMKHRVLKEDRTAQQSAKPCAWLLAYHYLCYKTVLADLAKLAQCHALASLEWDVQPRQSSWAFPYLSNRRSYTSRL